MVERDVTSVFDNPEGRFHVLINGEGQHSLWPAFIPVPDGWTPVLRDAARPDCQHHIDTHWTDLRPKSLAGC
ncbi:MbtH family protein [Inquilinus limosus]|uniref:MbtH family protein n=2 Tax=Inquilinus limosus TaxID=171674 RepID=A0A211ZNR2_9PROT|nr:MbtH family protein [Inquilinus limosus]